MSETPSESCCGASATARCPGCPLRAPQQVRDSGYKRIRTRTESGQDGLNAWSLGPDDLWECPSCSAAVKDPELHRRWHRVSSIGIDFASAIF